MAGLLREQFSSTRSLSPNGCGSNVLTEVARDGPLAARTIVVEAHYDDRGRGRLMTGSHRSGSEAPCAASPRPCESPWRSARAARGAAPAPRGAPRALARALLVPLYAVFTEGFDTPDPQDARALLNELR